MRLIQLIVAVAPALYLMKKVYDLDTIEKEPPALLRRLFLMGCLSVIPAVILEVLFSRLTDPLFAGKSELLYLAVDNLLGIALVEEGCKFFFLYKNAYRHPAFNYRFDGVVYAVFVSLGFALVENVLYVAQFGLQVGLVRALLSVPLHGVCGVYMGIAFGRLKARTLHAPAGLLSAGGHCLPLPVLIHGFYDFCLSRQSRYSLLLFILFVAAVFFLCLRRLRTASRQDAPFNGFTI